MRKWIRTILALGAFVLTLGVTARLLNEVQLFAEIPSLRDKWRYYQEHKDQYDALLIGTSRTYRGISPAMFDQLSGEAGVPTRSFNFGIDGMFPPEDAFVSDHVLRDPPKNLRWVFLEIGLFVDNFEGRNPDLVRTVYWHDWKRTLLCCRSRLWPKGKSEKFKTWFESEKGKATPASDCLTHLRLFFVKTLNLGRGSELLGDHFLNRTGKGEGIGPARDGYAAMPSERVMKGKELAEYQAEIKLRMDTPARIRSLTRYGEESLAGVIERVREIGAQPIVFIAPTTGSRREHPSEGLAVPTFDFRVPSEFPELFDPANRADPAHMNAAGADALTRRVADKFVKLARGQNPKPTLSPSR
ncbi:MAG TPA: hypothetical protein VFG14_07190 [Chthoniobacteraceae bacterium]|nr:hypothetical protein [Chthoniobacteraceae bacterium]